ncbi:hypothetical protein Noda2021_01500 [Candidatus Dependentiae bacterium Noda2021]|nr:hypothetical protein Noda2021_01500 [Candidatus Dependentiae bacterium Noda2021]
MQNTIMCLYLFTMIACLRVLSMQTDESHTNDGISDDFAYFSDDLRCRWFDDYYLSFAESEEQSNYLQTLQSHQTYSDVTVIPDRLHEPNTNNNTNVNVSLTTPQVNVKSILTLSEKIRFIREGIEFGTAYSEEENKKKIDLLLAQRKESLKFSCCDKKDLLWIEFTDHIESAHCIGTLYTCPYGECTHHYEQLSKAYHHAAWHHYKMLFSCPLCSAINRSITGLKNHFTICLHAKKQDSPSLSAYLNRQTKKYIYNVGDDITLESWKSVKDFIKNNHTTITNEYVCPYCSAKHPQLVTSASCLASHYNNNFFCCPTCKKNCHTYDNLKTHDIMRCVGTPQNHEIQEDDIHPLVHAYTIANMSSEDVIKKYVDSQIDQIACCATPLGTWLTAQNHFAGVHKVRRAVFQCPACQQQYSTSARALECYVIDINKDIFTCVVCKKKLSSRQGLLDHVVADCI